ncbi:MAG: beta-hydroxyacyl-ACP dehydratase [Fimbriiglobus sp.]|nr:beta-hydroxyacyl-ACP dehydratase [Fimbriiglobus sp.]
MRWIWIDRFTAFEPGRSATATKCLSHAEDHFAEHFPGFPVMPACLIIEGLAQTGGILVGEANQFREKVVLAKIPAAKFHREVPAGETLTYTATVVDLRDEGAVVRGTATCGGNPVCEVDIFFAHLDRNRAQQTFGDHNFVFTGEMQHLLGMARLAAAKTTPQLPPAPPADQT